MTARSDILIALWIAVAGALFVVSPFVAEASRCAFDVLESVGRTVYALGLALCVVIAALRLVRRTGRSDRTSRR